MGEMDLGSASASDLAGATTDYSVDSQEVDGALDQKETTWYNKDWGQQVGYYKTIPELRAAVDALARWTIGKGIKTNPITEMMLMTIKGNGNDTFNTILENMTRVAKIGGDSFAEIIRDKEGILVNLKPLNAGAVQIVANRKGVIIRYELLDKFTKRGHRKIKPNKIFHLCRNRMADEIHGVSLIDAVEWIILARNEAMADMKQLMHRHVKPRMMYHLATDDKAEIAIFKAKEDAANAGGENIYIPKDAVEADVLSVAANATLNPLPWIALLNQYFWQAAGVPQIIVGGSQELTEATAKILYLCFQQTIEEEQLYIEEQVLSQLNLQIELEMPVSLQNDMLSDNEKDGPQNIDPSETTAGVGQ